jgi:YkoY family integral membrane protein
VIEGIISSYSQFFSWNNMVNILSNPANWGIIFSLVILEGLLSADNALVLATMVSHLKGRQQKLALFAGMWGAYFFRFLVIGFGVYIIHMWWVKALGALYLLWMSAKYFLSKDKEEEEKTDKDSWSFWRTVVQVELMDIAFSVDSVSAAFGVSEQVWVLFLGAIFGILMMRGIAQVFVRLISKYPEFETTAFILIGIIGAKMMASVFGIHFSEWFFFVVLIATFLATFAYHHLRTALSKNN